MPRALAQAMHEGGGMAEAEAPAAVEEGTAGGPAATQTLHLGSALVYRRSSVPYCLDYCVCLLQTCVDR